MDPNIDNQSFDLPEKVREKSLDKLKKSGGFKNIEALLPKELKKYTGNFKPGSDEGEKSDFLEMPDYEAPRKDLRASLKALVEVLKASTSIEEIERQAQERKEKAEALCNANLGQILTASRTLEKTYRQLELMYANAGSGDIEKLTIINVDRAALFDKDESDVKDAVRAELEKYFLAIDQDKVYSFLVMPEFLGEELITTYAEIANDNKTLLLTDYKDFKSVQDIIDYREGVRGEKIGGPSMYWSHAVLFVNYIRLREKIRAIGEKDDLFGSPAMAIAGGIYNLKNNIAQPFAGYLHGGIKGSEYGLRIPDINQPQVGQVSGLGLNPIVNAFQSNMAFDARTLFDGENPELIHYAVVRTFDYIDKSLKHFLNQNVHTTLTTDQSRKIQSNIVKFLDKLKENNIIKDGKVTKFDRDRNRPDKIDINISIEPLWAVRTFTYRLDVSAGNTQTELESAES